MAEQKTRWSTVRLTAALAEEVEYIIKTEKYQKYGLLKNFGMGNHIQTETCHENNF